MPTLHLPCAVGDVSDGYHTFNELYEHRCSLFLALMKAHPNLSWISKQHADGSTMEGWFVAGLLLGSGPVTYHLPLGLWSLACLTGAVVRPLAPEWDGHTSADVVQRLQKWVVL